LLKSYVHLLLETANLKMIPGQQTAEVSCTIRIEKIFDIWRNKMKLSPPKQATWFVALALAVLALLGHQSIISALTPYAFWLALVSAALLVIATIVKGL